MNDIRIWIIMFVSVGGIVATLIGNYAIRGNDLKHLKELIIAMEERIMERIKRLEQKYFDKGE